MQAMDFVTQDGNVTYLFKVRDGSASSSLAYNVAQNIGFSKRIIDRSNQVHEYTD